MKFIRPPFISSFFPWILCHGPRDRPAVYMTFDDGPDPMITPQILEILNDYQVSATFFLIGEKVRLYPGIVEKIKLKNHLLGNHGFIHRKLAYRSKSMIRYEIKQTESLIHKITGKPPSLFRPPYGQFDLRFKKYMNEFQLQLVLWSMMVYDFQATTPQQIIQTVKDHLKKGDILIFHDGHRNGHLLLKALPKIIDFILERQLTFKNLDIIT